MQTCKHASPALTTIKKLHGSCKVQCMFLFVGFCIHSVVITSKSMCISLIGENVQFRVSAHSDSAMCMQCSVSCCRWLVVVGGDVV